MKNATRTTEFNTAFVQFFTGVTDKVRASLDKYDNPVFDAEGIGAIEGRRYVKITRTRDGKPTSVFCFVDKTNGNVLKAAGWSAPAKHARGNIYSDRNGMEGIGAFGAHYL